MNCILVGLNTLGGEAVSPKRWKVRYYKEGLLRRCRESALLVGEELDVWRVGAKNLGVLYLTHSGSGEQWGAYHINLSKKFCECTNSTGN